MSDQRVITFVACKKQAHTHTHQYTQTHTPRAPWQKVWLALISPAPKGPTGIVFFVLDCSSLYIV